MSVCSSRVSPAAPYAPYAWKEFRCARQGVVPRINTSCTWTFRDACCTHLDLEHQNLSARLVPVSLDGEGRILAAAPCAAEGDDSARIISSASVVSIQSTTVRWYHKVGRDLPTLTFSLPSGAPGRLPCIAARGLHDGTIFQHDNIPRFRGGVPKPPRQHCNRRRCRYSYAC